MPKPVSVKIDIRTIAAIYESGKKTAKNSLHESIPRLAEDVDSKLDWD